MKNFVLLLTIWGAFHSCAQSEKDQRTNAEPKTYEVSTNEEVLDALSKIKDTDLDKRDICIQRKSAFNDLILVAFFASDRGCMDGHLFYKEEYFNSTEATKRILQDHHWNKDTKLELALQYTKQVVFAWETVLSRYSSELKEDFGSFHKPQSRITEDHGVEIIVWVREPVGMQPKNDYYQASVKYNKDGALLEMKKLKTSVVWFDQKDEPEIEK